MSEGVWPPNWSQLIPDLIVAAVTSLVIGLILVWFQGRLSSSTLRTQYRQEFSRIIPALTPYFDGPVLPDISQWNHYQACAPVLDLIQGNSLSEWSRELDDERISALERFEGNLYRMKHTSGELDDRVRDAIIRSRPPMVPQTQLKESYREAGFAVRAIGLGIEDATSGRQSSGSLISDVVLTEWALEALADRQLADALVRYNIVRAALDKDHLYLREHLSNR